MDNREALKNMLNNLINDKHEEATLDFHAYATAKMKDVAGIGSTEVASDPAEDEVSVDDTETTDEE